MIKYIVLYLLFLLTLSTCSQNLLSQDKQKVLSTALAHEKIKVELKSLNDNYLVYPFFNEYNFTRFDKSRLDNSNYTNESELKILQRLKINEEDFSSLKKDIDSKYNKRFSEKLLELSNYDESDILIRFSGFNDRLIFMEVYRFCTTVKKEDLTLDFDFSKSKKEVFSFALLIQNLKINDVLIENIVTYSNTCNETLVFEKDGAVYEIPNKKKSIDNIDMANLCLKLDNYLSKISLDKPSEKKIKDIQLDIKSKSRAIVMGSLISNYNINPIVIIDNESLNRSDYFLNNSWLKTYYHNEVVNFESNSIHELNKININLYDLQNVFRENNHITISLIKDFKDKFKNKRFKVTKIDNDKTEYYDLNFINDKMYIGQLSIEHMKWLNIE